jgi:replicative DNA helicase
MAQPSNDAIVGVERALVAKALMDGSVLDRVELDGSDFIDIRSRRIWSAMCHLRSLDRVPNDVALLHGELGDGAGSLLSDALGFRDSDSATLMARSSALQYAADVRDAALRRRVRLALLEAADAPESGAAYLEGAWARLMELAKHAGHEDRTTTMAHAIRDAYREIEDAADGKPLANGVPTGIHELDAFGALPIGGLTLIGGRPGMGKSSLARTIAANVVATGHGVHVFSLEDTRQIYAKRQLSDQARFALERLMDAKGMNRQQLRRVMDVGNQHMNSLWLVDDTPAISSAQIAMRVRRYAATNKTKLVVIDYIQLMREKGAKSKQDEVSRAAEELAAMARNENVAVICMSQLSRDSEKRVETKRPMLSDLRESGVLEQVAHKVWICHRENYYAVTDAEKKATAGKGEVLIRKNKNGPTGDVMLAWDAECATYRPLAGERP